MRNWNFVPTRSGVAGGLVALLSLVGCATANTEGAAPAPQATSVAPGSLVLAATGDGPRGEEDWQLLPQYFEAEKADGRAKYLIHTGDLCKGSQLFDADYSARVAALYRRSSIPVIFVVGDNEWNDQPSPAASWPLWEKDFMRHFEAYPGGPEVSRQEGYPENIAWMDEGVLLIGINLVGGFMHDVEAWGYRHRANAEWIDRNLALHGEEAYAVVVIAQARPNLMHEDFMAPFVESVAAYQKPVLYLHGDGHVWELEENWRAPNLTRIQVDQVTRARPVHIMVSPENPAHPFSYDRHGAGTETKE